MAALKLALAQIARLIPGLVAPNLVLIARNTPSSMAVVVTTAFQKNVILVLEAVPVLVLGMPTALDPLQLVLQAPATADGQPAAVPVTVMAHKPRPSTPLIRIVPVLLILKLNPVMFPVRQTAAYLPIPLLLSCLNIQPCLGAANMPIPVPLIKALAQSILLAPKKSDLLKPLPIL